MTGQTSYTDDLTVPDVTTRLTAPFGTGGR